MAIYHFSVKTISRSVGRSATGAIAYRSGEKIECERLGITHDYTRKTGIEHKEIFLPDNAPPHLKNRERLWNEVEQRETRKNSTVAREFEIAFPSELNQEQREALLEELCHHIVERHQVAVDACIHAPHTDNGSDERNYHAHILMSTRRLTPEGFTEKSRELDQKHSGEIDYWRERFADTCNMHLEQAGSKARVDHRSYKDQENGLEATLHEGSTITKLRRQGIVTEISQTNDAIKQRNQAIKDQDKTLHDLIKQNEIQLQHLKKDQAKEKPHSPENAPNHAKPTKQQEQAEILTQLIKGQISAKEAHLDLDFMDTLLKKTDSEINRHVEHQKQHTQALAKEIIQSRLKKSHAQLQTLVDQYNDLNQKKPMLFGKKEWENQLQQIKRQHHELKHDHENTKENGVSQLRRQDNFKKYAWEKYQEQYPDKAEQYQKLARSYKIIKNQVDIQKAEDRKKLREEQEKTIKPRGMSR